jgi:predicted transcriptional regulator of viral defense system
MAREHLIHTTVGTELVRKLAEAGERIFTAEEARRIAPSVGLSPGYFRQALHHLARTGWVVRLRKGLYSLSGSMPGTTPLHEFEIAMALVEPAAISYWSALSYHGLTEQVPRRVFVLTTARSVPRARGAKAERSDEGYPVGETIFQFVQVKPERFFGIEEVWVNESRIKITDPERTLLDGLMAPQHCGDFAEVLHAFEVRGQKLDLERIIQYALKLDTATAKRLGWILERQGMEPLRLEPLRAVPVKGYRVLDPTGPRRGPCDARWMIQVNLPGKVKP